MAIGDSIVRDGPDNVCFGCSPHNRQGLQLRFTRVGPRATECRFTAEPHLAGAPGVVHGGIQATLLDEVLGTAAHTHFEEDPTAALVTVDFTIRYRRPVPVGEPLVIRGELVRWGGRDFYLEGQIESQTGEVLTSAEARWRRIAEPA